MDGSNGRLIIKGHALSKPPHILQLCVFIAVLEQRNLPNGRIIRPHNLTLDKVLTVSEHAEPPHAHLVGG